MWETGLGRCRQFLLDEFISNEVCYITLLSTEVLGKLGLTSKLKGFRCDRYPNILIWLWVLCEVRSPLIMYSIQGYWTILNSEGWWRNSFIYQFINIKCPRPRRADSLIANEVMADSIYMPITYITYIQPKIPYLSRLLHIPVARNTLFVQTTS